MKRSMKPVAKGKPVVAPVKSPATAKQIRQDIRKVMLDKLSK